MNQYAKTSPVTVSVVLVAVLVAASKWAADQGWISGPVTESDAAFYIAAVAVVVNEIQRRRDQILAFIREAGRAFRDK